MKKFLEAETILLAHRGLPLECPENTLVSFEKAAELGVDVIETDTHMTRDNQFIISHDAEISRVSNGTGLISAYTLEELKQFDAGYHFSVDGGKSYPFRQQGVTFMSLEEILDKFPNQRFNIDLKDNNLSQVKYYAEIIKRFNAEERVLTGSQFTDNLNEVRKLLPKMATSFSAGEVLKFYLKNKFKILGSKRKIQGDALQIPVRLGPFHLVKPRFIKNAHKLGYKIHAWTINDAEEMRRLFKMNVDGIFTDDPKLLKEVIKEFER